MIIQFSYHPWKIFPYILMEEAIKVHSLLRPLPELVGSPNLHMSIFYLIAVNIKHLIG